MSQPQQEQTANLKRDTIRSLVWNAFDKVGFQVIAFFIGLLTLRLLSPGDFGLIGALAIFTALSNIFIESGFTSAMVRRKDNKDSEYVAIMCFHIVLSVAFYIVLFFSAEEIANYYGMPELKNLSRFLFVSIIFNSVTIVQNIILTRQLQFKKLSLANLWSAIVSGIVTIVMIFRGYGYWALAWQILLQFAVKCVLLWCFSSWKPNVKPDFRVIRELFGFSFSLIVSSLVGTFTRYIYNPIIGERLGKVELGYYAEAYKFFILPSNIISNTVSGVSYPVLSKLNGQDDRQLKYLRKMVKMSAFGIFPILFGAMACFDNIVPVVLTEKWNPIVPYFRIMAIAGAFMPLHSLYTGLMTLKGYPTKSFLLEFTKNALILLPLLVIDKQIDLMLWSFTIATALSYFIDLFFVKRVMNYGVFDQLKDIFPYMFLSVVMALGVYALGWLPVNIYLKAAAQVLAGAGFYLAACYLTGSSLMKEMTQIVRRE